MQKAFRPVIYTDVGEEKNMIVKEMRKFLAFYDDSVVATSENKFWEINNYKIKKLPKYPNMLY